MDEELVKESLRKIDATTTLASQSIQILATTDQVISDEFDTLNKALADALAGGKGVTQELVDMASGLAGRSGAVADALTAMVPALAAIASKGITNPVPVALPPAPPSPPAPPQSV